MNTIALKNIALRGGLDILATAVVACIYCATVSIETILLGLIATLFISPSIFSFLFLEHFYSNRYVKFLGFFLPVIVIVALVFYQLLTLHSQTSGAGVSDGTSDVLVFFVKCYAIGLCGAFALLLFRRSRHAQE